MKKVLSIVLAMMFLLASFAAVAEDATGSNESLVNTALTEGRNVSIDATVSTNESLGSLSDASLHADVQLAGAPRLAFTLKNADETISDFMLGSDESNVYLRLSTLSDQTFAVSKKTVLQTLVSLVDASGISLGDALNVLISIAEKADAQCMADVTPDLSNVDLTPMMPALAMIMAKSTISDVKDYSMNEEALASADPVEYSEDAPAEDAESADANHGTIAEPVAMAVSIVLDKDDLAVLNNAIAATIEANPDYATAMGIDSTEVFENVQEFIDSLSESVTVLVNLDEDGCPVYGSMSFSVANDEGNNIAFLMQAYRTSADNTATYTFDLLVSTDDSDSYNSLFSVVCSTCSEEECDKADLAIIIGDKVNGFALEGQLTSENNTQNLTIESVTYTDSVRKVDLSINADGTLEVSGADFAATGTVTVYVQPETNTDPVISLTVSATTSDPIIEDYSNAVFIDQMNPSEEEQLKNDIADNIEGSVENYTELAEDTNAALSTENTNN